MSATPITTPQIVGWVLTGLGIAASFGWNLINHFRTDRAAKKLRGEQYSLNQWSRIRGAIDQALDGLVGASKAIIHQAHQLDDSNPQNAQIDLFNQLMIDAQDELASALEESALSPYCKGEHWRDAANGPSSGSETSWDRVLAIVEDARAANTKLEKIEIITKIRVHVQAIRALVSDYCRAQDLELEP